MLIKNEADGKNLLFIANPRAGTMQVPRRFADIMQLYSDAGYVTSVMMTGKRGDAREFAEKFSAQADITVVAGGDGTLNEVIDGIITCGSVCPIGYIPSGSTNDFATSVGLPKDIMAAARRTIEGEPYGFDIGNFNGRYFSYVASFGAFASTSYSVPQNLKNTFGHAAYIIQGARDVFNIKALNARVIVDAGMDDEKVYTGDYIMGATCNSTMVGGVLKLDKFDVDMNDGLMELLLIESPKNVVEAGELAKALLERTLEARCIEFVSAKNVRFEMDEPVHWTLDGEYEEGGTEAEIEALKSAVRIIK